MTFDEWRFSVALNDVWTNAAKSAWDAATAEAWKNPPEGWYRIGEEVEMDGNSNRKATVRAVIDVKDGVLLCIDRSFVRRVPAWEPKDGEAVFAKNRDGSASVARCIKVDNDYVVIKLQNGATGGWTREHLKPFDSDKIGKLWEEV